MTMTHQSIADELTALDQRSDTRRNAEEEARRAWFWAAKTELQVECGRLGHVYAPANFPLLSSMLMGHQPRACAICGHREAGKPNDEPAAQA